MSFLANLMFSAFGGLREKLQEFSEALETANTERAAWLLGQFQYEYPALAGVLGSIASDPPAEVVSNVAIYWPEFAQIPNVETLIADVQGHLSTMQFKR